MRACIRPRWIHEAVELERNGRRLGRGGGGGAGGGGLGPYRLNSFATLIGPGSLSLIASGGAAAISNSDRVMGSELHIPAVSPARSDAASDRSHDGSTPLRLHGRPEFPGIAAAPCPFPEPAPGPRCHSWTCRRRALCRRRATPAGSRRSIRFSRIAIREVEICRHRHQNHNHCHLLRLGSDFGRHQVHCADPSSSTKVSSFSITFNFAPPCCGVAFRLSIISSRSALSIRLTNRIRS